MDTFKISRLAILLLVAVMVADVFSAKPPSPQPEPQDVNVINTSNVTVTNPQASVTVDNTSSNPVPDTGSVTVDNTSPIPVNVHNQAGRCSEQQTAYLVAECTALKNTLILRIFLKLG